MTNSYSDKPALLVPVITPFAENGEPDARRFAQHCSWLLAQGAHGLVVFGTNSEANSLSVDERIDMLERLVASGIDPATLMIGTGCCSITDTARLSKHAIAAGCPDVLVMPPFFFPCDDDGIFAYYAQLIETIADKRLRLYLYHFPKMSRAPITTGLIERLAQSFPSVVAGVKDSAGVWEETEAMIGRFPALAIYSSSENLLQQNAQAGGAGCISATANVNARGIRDLLDAIGKPQAQDIAIQTAAVRGIFEKQPMVPAIKAYVARLRDDPQWATPRPPLLRLADEAAPALFAELDEAGLKPAV